MTKDETRVLLSLLETNYIKHFQNLTDDERRNTLRLWHRYFEKYSKDIVGVALDNYMIRNEYPPTIAGLQRQIDLLSNEGESDVELWNRIHRACQNAMYHSEEEFNRLPLTCQKWLGRPEQLVQFARIDPATLNTVTRGQFLKSIKEIKETMTARESLPQELRNKIDMGNMFQLSMNGRQEA